MVKTDKTTLKDTIVSYLAKTKTMAVFYGTSCIMVSTAVILSQQHTGTHLCFRSRWKEAVLIPRDTDSGRRKKESKRNMRRRKKREGRAQ